MAKGSSQWKKDMEAKPSSILSASTADPGAPWIQVSTPDNKLTLENVYLNGLHALHRLLIRNTTGFPLTVKLRSNLGPQMAFQLTNENLPDSKPSPSHGKGQGQLMRGDSMANFVQWLSMDSSLDSLSRPVMTSEPLSLDDGHSDSSSSSNLGCSMEDSSLGQQSTNAELWSQMLSAPPVTTNTVSAAIVNSNKESKLHGHHFNQLFNYVNYTDEIKLGPMEISSLILAFLPDEKLRSRRYKRMVSEGMSVSANTGSINSDGKDEQKDKGSDFNDDGQSFDFFEINGLLFFFAYKDVAPLSAVLESSSLPSGIPSEAVMRSEASTKEMHPQLPLSDIIPLSRALSISMIRDASGSSRTHPSSQVHSVSDSVTSSPLHNGSKEKDDPTPDFQVFIFSVKNC